MTQKPPTRLVRWTSVQAEVPVALLIFTWAELQASPEYPGYIESTYHDQCHDILGLRNGETHSNPKPS